MCKKVTKAESLGFLIGVNVGLNIFPYQRSDILQLWQQQQHIESEVPCDLPIAHYVAEMSCLRDGRGGATAGLGSDFKKCIQFSCSQLSIRFQ